MEQRTGSTLGKEQQERMRWVKSVTDQMDMNLSELQVTVKDREARGASVHGVAKSLTGLSGRTTTK